MLLTNYSLESLFFFNWIKMAIADYFYSHLFFSVSYSNEISKIEYSEEKNG